MNLVGVFKIPSSFQKHWEKLKKKLRKTGIFKQNRFLRKFNLFLGVLAITKITIDT